MKKPFLPFITLIVIALPFAVLAGGVTLFSPLKLAETDDERLSVTVSPSMAVGGKKYPFSYRTLARAGDTDAEGNTFGLLLDINGAALKNKSALRVSNRPDGNSAFERGGRFFLLTQFEDSPGAAYVTEFARGKDGSLTARSFNPVDFSVVSGSFINCSASRTPWDTHLASEEDYFLDAFAFDTETEEMTARHIGHCEKDPAGRITGGYSPPPFSPAADLSEWCAFVKGMRDDYLKDPTRFTPYNYGYSIELSPDSNGRSSIVNGTKHYAFGKYSPEMALVMPDERTVYITDDGSYAGFFMFVADRARDLSAGTLYMAKWTAEGERTSSSGSISWVRLGHGRDEVIKAVIEKKPSFSDIFEIAPSGPCGNGFKMVKAGGTALCLRPRDGKGAGVSAKFKDAREARLALSFLEARRYGAYLGATAEFTKTEGLAYNRDANVLYAAVSSIGSSMGDNPTDTSNAVMMAVNRCGAIYEGSLSGDNRDTSGAPIKSRFALSRLAPILEGRALKPGEYYAEENACHPGNIANPDNLGYSDGLLFVGEDSSNHMNNAVWAFDTVKKTLTRILSAPTGAEITGSFASLDIDGSRYLFINIQHPLGDHSRNAYGVKANKDYLKGGSEPLRRSYTGYVELPAPTATAGH
ncbi:MAG: hypothetical protein A2X99_03065 [Deltaproteobacteria bacterium GWB2_55_19]|nr:MAG: hypothetical protein A2X99_03065 [Deltaproteobacteria bacterium GWB2_55_19]HAO94356.1 hypothetical protein [Deltaproteobacteria bacterium]